MRIVLALLVLAVAAAAGAYFGDRPGHVEIVWQGWQIETSVGVLLAAVALLAFLVAGIVVLVAALRRAPRAWRRRRAVRRRRAGDAALTRGLVALAAEDAAAARRHAERAQALLGNAPVSLLLTAEAASRQGDALAARRAYTALIEKPETEFLGVRGLLGQALRDGDARAALTLAERARVLRPDAHWVIHNLLRLQAHAGNWEAARATLLAAGRRRVLPQDAARHHRGVVLYELSRTAEARGDLRRAASLASNAQTLAPDLAPIAVHHARLLLVLGHKRAAARAVERAWRTAPHPELAQLSLEIRPEAAPPARAASLQRLAARNPEAAESHLAIGEAALAARLWGEARRHLTLAAAAETAGRAPGSAAPEFPHARPSRRLCLLMARLEESDAANARAARDWLDRAIAAPPDPCYVCSQCGAESTHWRSLCGSCGSFDSLSWRTPSDERTTTAGSLPLAETLLLPPSEEVPAAATPAGAPSRLAPTAQSDN